MRRRALAAALFALAACAAPRADYGAYPDYVEAARRVWPPVMDRPFPARLTTEDADALHARIRERLGIEAFAYRDYRAFFAAVEARLEQDRALAPLAGVSAEDYAARVPAGDALALVDRYLVALARGEPTSSFWLGAEPRRAFERLVDFGRGSVPEGPALAGTAVGPVPAWPVTIRCAVAGPRGDEATARFTFQVSGLPPRLGILSADLAP